MKRSGTIVRSWVLAMLWLGLQGASATTRDGFQVIVHPDNPVRIVDKDFLRGAFLKRTTRWKHGPALLPVDLAEESPVRERFAREVLEKTPAQLRSYWIQRIFSGTGVPPRQTDTVAAAIAFVVSEPGAVAYLPAHVDVDGAKVVLVE